MTKKLNLSIPDDLAQEIEELRDYLGNLSALFQNSVRAKIRKKQEFEQFLKGDIDMGAVIDRLKQEKTELEGNFYEQGQRAGFAWAKAASYSDLKYVVTKFRPVYPVSSKGLPDEKTPEIKPTWRDGQFRGYQWCIGIMTDKVLGSYFRQVIKNSPPLSPTQDGAKPLEGFPPQWVRGWYQSVRDFWGEIKDKLSNEEFKPWLTVRHVAEDGKKTDMLPRYFKPLNYLDVVEKHNDHRIEFVVESISEGNTMKKFPATAATTITFHSPTTIYGLIEGGWLPLPFVNPPYFLADRNVISILEKLANGNTRQRISETGWWFNLLHKFSLKMNPLLYAWEGDCRRIPTYSEFRDQLDKASVQISSALPNADVIRFPPQNCQIVYDLLKNLSERHGKETEFLLYAAPLIAQRVASRKLRVLRRDVFNKAKELGLDLLSLVGIAVLSALHDRQDGLGHLIARQILKPNPNYNEQDAYNALSDLRHLELFIFTHALKQPPISLCTCDRAIAAFWCLVNPESISYDKGTVTYSVLLRKELFLRLSDEEYVIFLDELLASRGH